MSLNSWRVCVGNHIWLVCAHIQGTHSLTHTHTHHTTQSVKASADGALRYGSEPVGEW